MNSALFDPLPETGEVDPFEHIEGKHSGSYVPDDQPEELDEFETVRGGKSAMRNTDKKRKAQPNHNARAMTLLETMHPGSQLYVCEKRVTTWSGQIIKVDQWGFLDVCGITAKGAWIGCNITTKAAMAAHMREYTDPHNTHGQAQIPVIQLLEGYLARRGTFYIIGFDKPGSRWETTIWTVDQSLIDEYKARKRSR